MIPALKHLLRGVVLASLLLIGQPAFAQGFCGIGDTNQLVWNKDFQRKMESYFGDRKAELFWPDAKVVEQVLAGLSGPPDPLKRIDANTVLASACRHLSCMEKAAVVIECPNRIVSVGVIHYACGSGKPDCDADTPILTIYSNEAEGRRGVLVGWTNEVLSLKAKSIKINVGPAAVSSY